MQDHETQDLRLIEAKSMISELCSRDLVDIIGLTGGEPFARYSALLDLVDFSGSLGLASTVVTNARWAQNEERTLERLRQLKDAGLVRMAISYDTFHASFVPLENVVRAVQTAEQVGIQAELYVSYGSEDNKKKTDALVSQILRKSSPIVKKRGVIQAGAVIDTSDADLVVDKGHLHEASQLIDCPTTTLFTVWPSGAVFPCCSAGTHEKMQLGSIYHDTLDEILATLGKSEALKALDKGGPAKLLGLYDLQTIRPLLEKKYVSACDLCSQIAHALPSGSFARNDNRVVDWI